MPGQEYVYGTPTSFPSDQFAGAVPSQYMVPSLNQRPQGVVGNSSVHRSDYPSTQQVSNTGHLLFIQCVSASVLPRNFLEEQHISIHKAHKLFPYTLTAIHIWVLHLTLLIFSQQLLDTQLLQT
jgi:hypothetical protein